jgi:hypothetical protein
MSWQDFNAPFTERRRAKFGSAKNIRCFLLQAGRDVKKYFTIFLYGRFGRVQGGSVNRESQICVRRRLCGVFSIHSLKSSPAVAGTFPNQNQ